jgi:osmotically-inducible protein OsmY
MRIRSALTAMLLLTMTVLVAAQNTPAERDDIIAADVANIIGNHSLYSIYDLVGVEVENGVVTLSGVVTEPYKSSSFERAVHKRLPDVQVINKLDVLPPSSLDNRIRYLLARNIYNDSRLLRYSLARWPYPIHIIVRNGHVTLEGEVGTSMDKRLIETKVRNIIGVVSLTNNLTVS